MGGLNKMITKDKKGVIFTATTGMFILGLIIFAVIVYQTQEKGEEKIIPNSLATRILNTENSIQLSVKKIYETNTNLSLDIDTIINGNKDKTIIKTRLLENGIGNLPLKNNITWLGNIIEEELSIVKFDSNALNSNLELHRGSGIMINKTAVNPTTGNNEILQIYYNNSGDNKKKFYGINVTFKSNENLSDIINLTTNPIGSKHYINITINDMYDDYYDIVSSKPEDTIKIEFDSIASTHRWIVNNSDDSKTYLNITLDDEKLVIICNQGDYNTTIDIIADTNSTSHNFFFAPEVISIEIPEFDVKKTSRVSFR